MATVGYLKRFMSLALLHLLTRPALFEGLSDDGSAYFGNSTAADDGPPKCLENEFYLMNHCQTCEVFYSWMLDVGLNLTEHCGWQPPKRGQKSDSEEPDDPGRASELFSAKANPQRHVHESLRSAPDRHSDTKLLTFFVCSAFYSHVVGSGFNLETECGWLHPRLHARSSDRKESTGGGDQDEPNSIQDSFIRKYSWIFWSFGILLTSIITYSISGRLSVIHDNVAKWICTKGHTLRRDIARYFEARRVCEDDVGKKSSVAGNPKSLAQPADDEKVTAEASASTSLLDVSSPMVDQPKGHKERTARKSRAQSFFADH